MNYVAKLKQLPKTLAWFPASSVLVFLLHRVNNQFFHWISSCLKKGPTCYWSAVQTRRSLNGQREIRMKALATSERPHARTRSHIESNTARANFDVLNAPKTTLPLRWRWRSGGLHLATWKAIIWWGGKYAPWAVHAQFRISEKTGKSHCLEPERRNHPMPSSQSWDFGVKNKEVHSKYSASDLQINFYGLLNTLRNGIPPPQLHSYIALAWARSSTGML